MDKIRKKFVLYAALAVLIMLTVLLSVINVMNFTMAAQDADRVTGMIAAGDGRFAEPKGPESFTGKNGPMGPDSPETKASVRYFTYRFNKSGESEQVAYFMSAIDEKEAETIAASLVKEKTGWVRTTYRYRVYRHDGFNYVTVVDYGRELLPAYRVLVISISGTVVCVLISVALLFAAGKKLFAPLEEAERKQKNFIKEAEAGFKVPLTVINADADMIEQEGCCNEYTKSIRRQVRKLTELTNQLYTVDLLDEKNVAECDLSMIVTSVCDAVKHDFAQNGIEFECSADPSVTVKGDAAMLHKMIAELTENARKFSIGKASLTLRSENGKAVITAENDTDLPDCVPEQIFDRFTRLGNASGKPGSGLGLSYVKDIVKAHNGRMSVSVAGGLFTLRITI